MKTNLDQHITLVRNFFAPYYRFNDKAHQLDHVDEVAKQAIHICTVLNKKSLIPAAIVAAYAHDMFTRRRETHHMDVFNWIMAGNLPPGFARNEEEMKSIAWACRTHRASCDEAYYDVLGEIVASADRGLPDVESFVRRSFLYAKTKEGKNYEDSVWHSINHIKEKFGTDGYARYPDIYRVVYGAELAEMTIKVDALDADKKWERLFLDWWEDSELEMAAVRVEEPA